MVNLIVFVKGINLWYYAQMEDKCPLCLRNITYDLENNKYFKYKNTERLVCKQCATEVKANVRPTWQIISNRIFYKSLRND